MLMRPFQTIVPALLLALAIPSPSHAQEADPADVDCLSAHEPKAWSSPIFVDQADENIASR